MTRKFCVERQTSWIRFSSASLFYFRSLLFNDCSKIIFCAYIANGARCRRYRGGGLGGATGGLMVKSQVQIVNWRIVLVHKFARLTSHVYLSEFAYKFSRCFGKTYWNLLDLRCYRRLLGWRKPHNSLCSISGILQADFGKHNETNNVRYQLLHKPGCSLFKTDRTGELL